MIQLQSASVQITLFFKNLYVFVGINLGYNPINISFYFRGAESESESELEQVKFGSQSRDSESKKKTGFKIGIRIRKKINI